MTPNWFIGFPMQVEGLWPLPDPPRRVRVFAEEDLHCTLVFLGAVGADEAKRGWSVAREMAFEPVQGRFDEVRALGNPSKPSALSAIVGDGSRPLASMIDRARRPVAEAVGARVDARPPLPHMTVARIQRRAGPDERRAALSWAQSLDVRHASFRVGSLGLYTWAEDRAHRLFQIVEEHPCEV
ncbi:MAG: 2'-5' RNA ligase family protein [Myxococcota bacterium]